MHKPPTESHPLEHEDVVAFLKQEELVKPDAKVSTSLAHQRFAEWAVAQIRDNVSETGWYPGHNVSSNFSGLMEMLIDVVQIWSERIKHALLAFILVLYGVIPKRRRPF